MGLHHTPGAIDHEHHRSGATHERRTPNDTTGADHARCRDAIDHALSLLEDGHEDPETSETHSNTEHLR
jgi:hypothetical protein